MNPIVTQWIKQYFKFDSIPSGNIPVKCPFKEHSNPLSASINFQKGLFQCFVPTCVNGLNFQQLYDMIQSEEKLSDDDNVKKFKKAIKENEGKIVFPKLSKSELLKRAKAVLKSRGINNCKLNWVVDTEKFVDNEPNPFYGYLIFESSDQENLVARNLIEEVPRPKYRNPPGEKEIFWVSQDSKSKVIWMAEGIFDALSLVELGVTNVISANSATGYSNKEIDNVSYSLRGYTILICFDADAEGFKGARRLADKFKEYNVDHSVVDFPSILGKDINEALQTDRDRLKSWIRTINQTYDPSDFIYITELFENNELEPLNVIPTGIKALDTILTGGFKDGGHIISGNTGIGKTSIALAISSSAAEQNKRVMINSCEISKRQTWSRIASRYSKHPWYILEEHPELIEPKALAKAKELSSNIRVVNGWPTNRIIQDSGDYDLIVIDYIQRVREAYGGDENATRFLINQVTSKLTDLGALNGKVIIIISSLGRASYNKPDDYGLKESGSLEYMGTTVSRLFNISPGLITWNVQKNNRGPHKGRVNIRGIDLGHCDLSKESSEEVNDYDED